MLEKITVKPIKPKKTPYSEMRSVGCMIEQHTRDFLQTEAEARNMSVSGFVKEILERLESGEF